MRAIVFLVALLAAFGLLAESARPSEPCANVAPASHVYADALFRAAAADADRWWVEAGWPEPPALDLRVCDTVRDDAAYGAQNSGTVWLSRSTRNNIWVVVSDPYMPTASRRATLALFWVIAAHERGHNIGLGHHPVPGCVDNLMCAETEAVPSRALAWARKSLTAIPARIRRQ